MWLIHRVVLTIILLVMFSTSYANIGLIGTKYDVHHLPPELKNQNFAVELDKNGMIVKLFKSGTEVVEVVEPEPVYIDEPEDFVGPIQLVNDPIDNVIGTTYNTNHIPDELKNQNFAVELDHNNKILKVFTAGIIENIEVIKLPDVNQEVPVNKPVIDILRGPIEYTGKDALNVIGDNIDALALEMQVTPDYLKEQFLMDNTLKVDAVGHILSP